MSLDSSNSQYKELGSACVERDNNDFLEILTWFCTHNPFTTSEKLVCLDSGFIDGNNTVNCDKLLLLLLTNVYTGKKLQFYLSKYKLLSMFVLYTVCLETKHAQTKRWKKYNVGKCRTEKHTQGFAQ